MAALTIAGLAREGDVGVETVRYYQRRGLLDTPDRPGGSGASGGIRRYGVDVSCPLLSGPSTMTVWIKEGTTNAFEEAQARGDYREAA